MAEPAKRETGVLHIAGGGGGFKLKRMDGTEVNVKAKQFEDNSKAELESLKKGMPDRRGVTFELVSGQPKDIRLEATPAPPSRPPQDRKPAHGPGSHRPQGGPRPIAQAGGGGRPAARREPGDFHNPYNFVPALPRDGVRGELGDRKPTGGQAYHPNRISGVIRVRLTAKTPLLLPDAARAVDVGKDHKSFPVRVDDAGNPYIPPTSVKGMLRAAYEAVTNSRLAVFPFDLGTDRPHPSGHAVPLAYRAAAGEGLGLVPARIEGNTIRLLMGTTKSIPRRNGPNWIVNGPMYAAWLPMYRNGKPFALKYPDNSAPRHGDEVTCWISEWRHRSDRFSYWKVDRIFPRGKSVGERDSGMIEIDGFVCITNANIRGKHDERVFFLHEQGERIRPLTAELKRSWHALIRNYQETHADDLAKRKKLGKEPEEYLGGEPGKTAWSRHVYTAGAETLDNGTLCYALLDDREQIIELFPVMISRRLFDAAPVSLLPQSLRPAERPEELSPADRVFGWVNQGGKRAYRGNVRVGPVRCESETQIEWFNSLGKNLFAAEEASKEPGLPLAILGQPKPQQARFYIAESTQGEAQRDSQDKVQAGYAAGKGLRGRKVYPHPRKLPANHWSNPTENRTQQPQVVEGKSHFQEYRRPEGPKVRDNQNRSVQGWIKSDSQFAFELHVTNLSETELGALLWLLSLEPEHFHRFGGGKPLGFGSVRLEIVEDGTALRDGGSMRKFYSTLDDLDPPIFDYQAAIAAFKTAVTEAYRRNSFEETPFIAAFLRAAAGHPDALPIHYPRARPVVQGGPVPPHPEGKSFEWFVANERTGGRRVALSDLADDKGLPMLDAN